MVLDAARCAGLQVSTVEPLSQHASAVFLLPSAQVVARISRDPDDQRRAQTSVAITAWLVGQDFPATAPADVNQPVRIDDVTVTFWRYYPQGDRDRPPAAALGTMLQQLHQLPTPPVDLQPFQPLKTLGDTIEHSTTLPDSDRHWLAGRRKELLDAYESLSFPLGSGFIHGDAYPGNTVWDGDCPRLGDWDEVGTGPRELDLVNTHQGARFGRTALERQQFTNAYGYDVTAWSGFPILREIRDLHTLASYIRLADAGDDHAHTQLTYRLSTLKAGDDQTLWIARH
ncbi:MAG: aminoglycoside phosphotransferase family protein [Actinobacteria bacterium]|nr:aminoglycoside phosphotransferase family protein [Actinomycetota bacterium]